MTRLSPEELLQISRKEIPDTLLMGFNHFEQFGFQGRILSFQAVHDLLRSIPGSISIKVGGLALWLRRLKDLDDLPELDFVLCKNVYPGIGTLDVPFGILDVIVYDRQPLQKFLARLLQKAKLITYNTRAEGDLLLDQMGMGPNQAAYLPWGVDDEFFRPHSNGREPPVGNTILSVGSANRDYIAVAWALKHLEEDVTWTIVTGGPLKFRTGESRYNLSLIREIFPPVNIIDRCHPTDLRQLYSQASLVVVPVYPSVTASGVTTLLEAMAMERPCVVARSPGLMDYVEDAKTALLYEPSDRLSLTEALSNCLNAQDETAAVAKNARLAVELRFNTRRGAQRLLQLMGMAQGEHGG